MHDVTIDLTQKPQGYKEALDKFIKARKAVGTLVEACPPDLVSYHTSVRRVWRVKQINPTQVCALVAHGYAKDDTYVITLSAAGPRRDLFDNLVELEKPFTLSTRIIVSETGKLLEIVGFDIAMHKEPDTVIVKIKKGV